MIHQPLEVMSSLPTPMRLLRIRTSLSMDKKGMWRTLSNSEWNYLIDNNGCLWTTINGINGLIVFCDGYSGSRTGLTEIPIGCLFLPAAGFRGGRSGTTFVYDAGDKGVYWTACPSDYYYAYDLSFRSGVVNPYDFDGRIWAQFVRLVLDVK